MKKLSITTFKDILSEIKREQFFPLLILFIAILGIFNALRFGGASVEYNSVRNAINAWQADARIQSKEEFEQTKTAIYLANALHSSNPLYMDLNGLIKEWGAVSGFEEKDSLIKAKMNYLETTKVRPLWPVTWANLAMVKWRLQEFDDEMLGYLAKADELGPQSFEVHVLFSHIGISLYAANHPMYAKIKDIVHTRLRLGLRNSHSKEAILSFIDSSESLATVCRWMLQKDKYSVEKHLSCSE